MSDLARVVGCNSKDDEDPIRFEACVAFLADGGREQGRARRIVNSRSHQVVAFEMEAKAARRCRSWSSMAGAGSVRQVVHELEHDRDHHHHHHDHDARPHCSADAVEHYSHPLLSLSLGRLCPTATLRSNKALEAAAMPTL